MAADLLHQKIRAYKRKYFLNKLIKGSIILGAIFLSIYLIINVLEFSFRFDSSFRTVLFFSSILLLFIFLIRWIFYPIYQLLTLDKQLGNEEAAKQIGKYFPEVQDKLLNLLQLEQQSDRQNELIIAGIEQKTQELKLVSFDKAIEIKNNRKYLKYIVYPGLAILLILLFIPAMLTESTERIIKYDEEFKPSAPFEFIVVNEVLEGFRNEDFNLEVKLEGQFVPDQVYIKTNGRRIKLKATEGSTFQHSFKKVQASQRFRLEAAGFETDQMLLTIHNRPTLREYFVNLDYPAYTGKKDEKVSNSASLVVPEGTVASWSFGTAAAQEMHIITATDSLINVSDGNLFKFERRLMEDYNFEVRFKNDKSFNTNRIVYNNKVIKDEYPQVSLESLLDTVLYSYIILGGNISDDYGLRNLQLKYRISGEEYFRTEKIKIQSGRLNASYFYQWRLDSLNLKPDQSVEYYVQVFDNDGVNGSKSTKSQINTYQAPSKNFISDKIDNSTKQTEKQINKTLEKAKDLQDKLEDINESLKVKQKMDWQDKKVLEDILKKKEELTKELEKLQKENKALNQSKEAFQKPNEKIVEKVKELQKLMDEILDEETKKLYDELKKLLEENTGVQQLQEKVDEIKDKEKSLENELERALELFKRLKMENKLDESINKLDELQQKQEQLAEDSKDKKNKKEDLLKEQEDLAEEFKELQDDLDEVEQLNQDLKDPEPMQDYNDEEQSIQEQMEQSQENLEKNKRKNASENQQNSAQKMQQMKQKMQQMQAGMEMQMLQENLGDLREIVDNLVKLSFNQEQLMKDFKGVKQSDPRFVTLSQTQLKIKDDSKIIQDSLLALAERVFQISSFVTREVEAMNQYMDESVESLRDRNKSKAVSSQQFAMTSINNLSILLDDVLQQMQQQMADAMGKPKSGKQKNNKNMPGLSELQKELSKKIDELKKSGKSGRQLSEELAKLAAEQEMIRRQMEQMQEKEGMEDAGGKGNMDKIIKDMKKNEEDLVNKRLSNELIKRQQDIVTRMLKAEDALRERELDEEKGGRNSR